MTLSPKFPDQVKCKCQHCNQVIEFSPSQYPVGTVLLCPYCGMDTTLYSARAIATANTYSAIINERRKLDPKIFIAIGVVVLCIAAFIFFPGEIGALLLPSIIGRNKHNSSAIFVLNLVAGWTFIGWVVAIVWACAKDPQKK